MRAPAAAGMRWRRDDLIARGVLLARDGVAGVFLLAPMLHDPRQRGAGQRWPLRRPGAFRHLLRRRPALLRAAWNSIWVAAAVVLISVPLAFVFAYALTRSCLPMPFKGTFRLIALIPLLAPSLLSAIAFIQWFGNQGAAQVAAAGAGASIYGAPGIILAEVYNTFPHALMILLTALSLADGRLYEAADCAGARGRWRKFFTITLPSCKYGLISAAHGGLHLRDQRLRRAQGDRRQLQRAVGGRLQAGGGAAELRRWARWSGLLLLVPSIASFVIDSRVRRKLTRAAVGPLGSLRAEAAARLRRADDGAIACWCARCCWRWSAWRSGPRSSSSGPTTCR